ncbi:unnamed protein product [Rotaria magnacalcarata]|uniref:TATA box-binding protein-like 1 n=1 Tax=Rotaria magnacalcarata TaxID=392030 RepID=A0A816LHS9_9BILA|nr:unnamed protein product [Rotaria magnacalcarata]CAF1353947.1 unnamed protein product [Rotaria magnacalcarata]CAF1929911.1 unnamed protein product [Rotaria magnacalcarata]
MFQTTNVTTSAVPAAAVVRPSYQIMTTSNNHHTIVPASSTNPSWRLTTPTSSVVSILNGNSSTFYIATQPSTTTNNILRQSTQTVHQISPSFTILNNSNTIINGQIPIISSLNNNFSSDTCVDGSILGRLPTSTIPRQQMPRENLEEQTSSSGNDIDIEHNQQDSEIELFVSNVVCSFALGCKLNLRKIAMEAANVIYKRDHAMVLMKIRNPYCSATVWSSGKVTVTGTTSEDDAERAARRIARCLQRLGYKTKFRNYRVVNCLATCSMPWPIDIVKLSRTYPGDVSYEPEIHPGATVRLKNKVVLKVFTTGSVTLTAPSVELINTAVNEFYPKLFECRKQFGTNLYRRLSMTPLSTNIYPAIGYQPSNFRTPLPRQLPSSQSIPMPTTLPASTTTSNTISILDKCSLYNDLLYYDCPSMTNEKIQCAWTSTNYRYKRQRRVRNHPSRLTNTIAYRSRRMRLHHKKKWLKKFKYDLLKKLREKIKRRGKLYEMENSIILGKAEQFNAEHYVKRELEKAKFYGYRVSPVYDQIRDQISRLKLE